MYYKVLCCSLFSLKGRLPFRESRFIHGLQNEQSKYRIKLRLRLSNYVTHSILCCFLQRQGATGKGQVHGDLSIPSSYSTLEIISKEAAAFGRMPCLLILELLRMRRVRFWGVQDLRVLTIQFFIFHNFFSNGPVLFGSTTAFGCSNSHSKTDACLLQIPDHEALSLRIFSGQPAPFGGISDSRFLLKPKYYHMGGRPWRAQDSQFVQTALLAGALSIFYVCPNTCPKGRVPFGKLQVHVLNRYI